MVRRKGQARMKGQHEAVFSTRISTIEPSLEEPCRKAASMNALALACVVCQPAASMQARSLAAQYVRHSGVGSAMLVGHEGGFSLCWWECLHFIELSSFIV